MLNKSDQVSQSSWGHFFSAHKIISVISGLVLLGVIIFLWWWNQTTAVPIYSFVFGQKSALDLQKGRVNILLLGMAGGKHDGATLTDTIIIASYDPLTSGADLISLPRDLWVDTYQRKINTLYQTGLAKKEGLKLTKQEIGNILGITIPYAVRIDFSGFIQAIDLIGGIDVEIEKNFDDYFYPVVGKENDLCDYTETEMDINKEQSQQLGVPEGRQKVLLDKEGKVATASSSLVGGIKYGDQQVFNLFKCRFEHLQFSQGLTHMDGETALKFVRSRHGTNQEGSDFARSKRQQLVIQAFRNKVLSLDTLLDPQKITSLLNTLGQSIDSDIPSQQYLEFSKLIKKVDQVKNHVINESGPRALLMTPPAGNYGAWVLVPTAGDFSQIQQYIQEILSGTKEASMSSKIEP